MKRSDRKALVGHLLFLIVIWASGGSAQEEGSGAIPPDSAKYAIRIPDIIIYGEDVEKQSGGVKLGGEEIGLDYPRLKAFKPMAHFRIQRVSSPSPKIRPLLNLIFGGFGRFHTCRFGGWRSESVGAVDYHLRASSERSRGHLKNASYWSLEVGGSGRYSLTDGLGLASNLSYSQEGFGLYGINPQRRRGFQKVDLSFALKGEKRYSWEACLGYQEVRVKEKGDGSSSSLRERIWDVGLGGQAEYRRISVLSDVRLRSFKPERVNGEDLWEARVEGESSLADKGNLGAGFKVQVLARGERRDRFSPLFYLNYIPRGGVGFSFHLSGGLTPRLLGDSFSQNRYLHLPQRIYWEDVKVRASLGVEYEVKKGLLFKDMVVHQQTRDYRFWEGDSGLFRLEVFPEVRTLENSLIFKCSPYPKLNMELSLVIRDADLTKGGPSTWYITYWERAGFHLALDFPLRWGIECWLGGEYHSQRATSSTLDDPLEVYQLFNLKINKNLNDNFKVFLEGNNLTNSRYEIWKGYREPGINGLLGLSFRW